MTIADRFSNDERIISVETEDHRGRQETAIDGEPLLRVVCREPSDVDDLAEVVDDPFEADIPLPTRFLIDMAHTQWIQLSEDALQKDTVSTNEIHLPSYDDTGGNQPPEDVPPLRNCIYDIEVQQGGNGPPVVSKEGTEKANNDITAITAYDTYTMGYHSWILLHDSWDAEDTQEIREYAENTDVPCEVSIYQNPRDVVAQFTRWVIERDFDSLVAWNGAGFDHPYLVNYGLKNGVGAIKQLSPTRHAYPMDGNGSWINSSLKGRLLLDLMVLYKKTRVAELDSYRLTDVANAEGLSVGKLSIEDEVDVPNDVPAIDYVWKEHPEVFFEYSLKDVRACVGINDESQKDVSII